MHLRILSMAALASLAVAVLVQPAAPQAGGDKKKDDQAKKDGVTASPLDKFFRVSLFTEMEVAGNGVLKEVD